MAMPLSDTGTRWKMRRFGRFLNPGTGSHQDPGLGAQLSLPSIVPVGDVLLPGQRESPTKIGSQNRTCPLPESGNTDSARSR